MEARQGAASAERGASWDGPPRRREKQTGVLLIAVFE
jgi:hypothetical protein